MIQKHIGVGPGIAGGIGAAPLALVLIDVDPAVIEALLQQLHIVVAQNLQGLQYRLLGLGIADLLGGVGHDGGVHVVHVQLIHAQKLLAQGDIAVHLVQVGMNRFDQVQIDLLGHLRLIQGRCQGVGIFPRGGEEAALLELRVQGGGDGVFKLAQAAVVGVKGVLAQHPVAALQQGDKGAVGELVLSAVLVLHLREFQVRVAEHAADIVRALGHFSRGGKEGLLRRRQDVLCPAADTVQAAAIGLQLGLGDIEQVQGILGDSHNLRCGKGRRAGDGHKGAHGLAAHILIHAVALVLIVFAAGIAVQGRQAQLHLILQTEEGKKALRALAQLALEGGNAPGHLLQGLVLFVPGLVAFKHVAQVPGKLLGNLASFGNFIFCHG